MIFSEGPLPPRHYSLGCPSFGDLNLPLTVVACGEPGSSMNVMIV